MKGLKNNRGFTMIEVLVVVTMLGILAAIFVPKVTDQVNKPKNTRAMIEIRTMKNALDIYFAEENSYPTDASDIADVMEEHGVLGGKFGTEKALDPWGNPYYFIMGEDSYTIWSEGPEDDNDKMDDIATEHKTTEVSVYNDNLDPTAATTNSTIKETESS